MTKQTGGRPNEPLTLYCSNPSFTYEVNFNHPVERRSIVDLDVENDLSKIDVDIVLGGFPFKLFHTQVKELVLVMREVNCIFK